MVLTDQDVFEHGGRRYMATNELEPGECTGCALRMNTMVCAVTPPCCAKDREDGTGVIWVRAIAPVEAVREDLKDVMFMDKFGKSREPR
jgi:hypothetical protein